MSSPITQSILLRRSAIAGKIPTTSSLQLGELALNTNDGKAFMKKDDGVNVTIEQFDQAQQANWHMPDEYRNMDIAQWLLDQCSASSA